MELAQGETDKPPPPECESSRSTTHISTPPPPDLRSSAGALCPWRRECSLAAGDRRGRHSPSHAVWHRHGRAALDRPRRPRARHLHWHGPGSRHGRAPRRDRRQRQDGRCRWHRRRRSLSKTEQPSLGTDSFTRRSADLRIRAGHSRRTRELSHPRNRIISGMSIGGLVVEAAEYSGTRIPARCAREQNCDLFAVPGNVTNKNSWEPNTLIKQGAQLVATWEGVWEELPENIRLALTPARTDESPTEETASLFPSDDPLSPHQRKIFALLKADQATHIDEIVERLGAGAVVIRNFRRVVRIGTGGKGETAGGEEFCEGVLALSSQLSARRSRRHLVQSFRNLKVWEKAHILTLDVCGATRAFPREEIYGLTSQMRRGSASIGANIAEGCCRKADTDMGRFMQIAMGPASELEYHCLWARDLKFLEIGDYDRLRREVVEVKRMLAGLIRQRRADG